MENDIFYIFSDGYVDQFGGSENKKFMYRRFRFLLTKIHNFSVDDQKSILEEEFRGWMGNNVQVDDIMVIGFRPLSTEILKHILYFIDKCCRLVWFADIIINAR